MGLYVGRPCYFSGLKSSRPSYTEFYTSEFFTFIYLTYTEMMEMQT